MNMSVLCPVSLETTAIDGPASRCHCCGEILPPLYLKEGQNMLPIPIQFFGLNKHGKTSYLAALTLALQRVNTVWNGFTATPATESSRRTVREINRYFDTGQLPPATPPRVKDCYLMLLNRIPKWGNAALMIRDCPGAAFREIDVDLDEANFLLKGTTTFLFISLEDLEGGYTVDALMTNYLSALVAHGVALEDEFKKVLVVLTKADLLLEVLPGDLLRYVQDDPIWLVSRLEAESSGFSVADMEEYLKTLDRVSDSIEEWIRRRAAGRTLVTLARDRNVEVRFSLVSATGSAPLMGENTLSAGWEPSRVLDPFLWALELDSRRRRETRR